MHPPRWNVLTVPPVLPALGPLCATVNVVADETLAT